MLSTLASISDKTFIVAYVLPLLLFLIAGAALFIDIPAVRMLLVTIAAGDSFEKLTYLVIAIWVLALLLQMVNHMQLQILEGYRWPVSRLAYLQQRQDSRFDAVYDSFQALDLAWKTAIQNGKTFPPEKEAAWDDYRTRLVTYFPNRKAFVLPTRFGNAIRAFETYAADVYGADPIPLWIHLSMVMPKDVLSATDDARAQLSCLVNIVFFSGLIALAAIVRFLLGFQPVSAVSGQPHWIELPILFGGISWIYPAAATAALLVGKGAYELAIEQALAWGELVKAAFDCFLPALAKSLGYNLPATGAEQKAFWLAVSRRAIQNRPLSPENWPGAGASEPPSP